MKRMWNLLGVSALLAGLLAYSPAHALQYSTRDGVMRVSGKYEGGDLEALRTHLAPDVKVVVLGDIQGGNWDQGRELADVIGHAGVTTVVHGTCSGWACSMMFLAGSQRMFSGAGRPESQRLEIPFIAYLPNYDCGGYHCTDIPDWLTRHTRLTNADLRIYHKSLITATSVTPPDFLEFLPAQARTSGSNVRHCARETIDAKKAEFALNDCFPVPEASALNRGIVTTDERFTHRSIRVKDDTDVPPASDYARIDDPIDTGLAMNVECRALRVHFLHSDSPRAIVVSRSGGCYIRTAQNLRPYAEAMAACKANRADCRFYAVDDAVVFVPFDKPVVGSAEQSGAAD